VIRRVRPLADIGPSLLEVEKPARYLGGEFGSSKKEGDELFTIALCFPDLYEIGMSNNAIRILYAGLNRIPSLRCERVFAPAPDFEALLKKLGLPLYTLETGIPIREADILGFSLGYELAATSLLSVLAAGEVPILATDRNDGDPIVIAGGPAISNPHPFSAFLDAAYIGEAEDSFFRLAEEMALLKSEGARRIDLLERMADEAAIWLPERKGVPGKKAIRAIYRGFSETAYRTAWPVPTLRSVQDHGTVEIMRGCPNGCRFCHAGYFYRPQRSKSVDAIHEEVEYLVRRGGYREITLASLSSGDYIGIGELLRGLNAKWSPSRVSFQLPSLKINGFTLPLLESVSEVRKSGLTFAVETPVLQWQSCINKDVSFEKTLEILEAARGKGFKQAKFYFMIGLPVSEPGLGEAEAIIDFFNRLYSRMNIQISANIGTFVPKPHTPFQSCAQLSEERAMDSINTIRSGLRRFRNLKFSYHSPFVSQLEGIIARGDERVGDLIFEAFRRGARLDAWEERLDRKLWREVLESASWPVVAEICGEKDSSETRVWDDVSIRVSSAYLQREHQRAQSQITTSACAENCTSPCGSCLDSPGIMHKAVREAEPCGALVTVAAIIGRVYFSFSKQGLASYYPHLSIVDAFSRAFLMEPFPVAYSEGFNPMPRLELVQPIPIAVGSKGEVAAFFATAAIDLQVFIDRMNRSLPEGLRIENALWRDVIEGERRRSLGSMIWGSEFLIGLRDARVAPQDLDSIAAGFTDSGIPGLRIELNRPERSLRVSLPEAKRKTAGLIGILERCIEQRPVQSALEIFRTRVLAEKDGLLTDVLGSL
jgi:radical SAM family uncharacterized protein